MSEQYSGNRLVVLDTETTGIETSEGHRIIEIGCVELCNRRLSGNNLHLYLQPDCEISAGAQAVHGISNEFLQDKPRFAEIATELRDYLKGAELIIHNASFDVSFIEHEFRLMGTPLELDAICTVTDTLKMSRQRFPGQRNSLDALCKRLGVDNSRRSLHGALLDAEILADVYLILTGGQSALLLDDDQSTQAAAGALSDALDLGKLIAVKASGDELVAHEACLGRLEKEAASGCVWRQIEAEAQVH